MNDERQGDDDGHFDFYLDSGGHDRVHVRFCALEQAGLQTPAQSGEEASA
jgi:hypothetical protein